MPEKVLGEGDAEVGDGVRIMPLGAHPTSRGAGSLAGSRELAVGDGRPGLRGKNGSARLPGTHKPPYREWRDGEIPASPVLRSGPVPTPA